MMENEAAIAATALIGAYLIGSFPAPYIMGRLRKGIDIREVGTRNMGAANVFYQVGAVEGVIVLLLDVGKGAAAVYLARSLGAPLYIELVAAAVVVAGHVFPVFLKFRGGKGGAALIGALAFLLPLGVPIYLGIFGVALLISRFPTFSYSLALYSVPIVAALLYHSSVLVIFSVGMILVLSLRYVPRVKEMYSAAGGWRRVILRTNLKQRF
jgi:glycerol-3-phosphate acyltransferase PlsY